MEAGRELDALVAEKVMGCHPRWTTHRITKERIPYTGLSINKKIVPCYSTDIAAAWQVLGKLEGHFEITLEAGLGTQWRATFAYEPENECFYADSDKAPLAVCLAALEAVKNTKGAINN